MLTNFVSFPKWFIFTEPSNVLISVPHFFPIPSLNPIQHPAEYSAAPSPKINKEQEFHFVLPIFTTPVFQPVSTSQTAQNYIVLSSTKSMHVSLNFQPHTKDMTLQLLLAPAFAANSLVWNEHQPPPMLKFLPGLLATLALLLHCSAPYAPRVSHLFTIFNNVHVIVKC